MTWPTRSPGKARVFPLKRAPHSPSSRVQGDHPGSGPGVGFGSGSGVAAGGSGGGGRVPTNLESVPSCSARAARLSVGAYLRRRGLRRPVRPVQERQREPERSRDRDDGPSRQERNPRSGPLRWRRLDDDRGPMPPSWVHPFQANRGRLRASFSRDRLEIARSGENRPLVSAGAPGANAAGAAYGAVPRFQT